MKITKEQPEEGQFVAMWVYGGNLWSENRKIVDGKVMFYLDSCEGNEIEDEWVEAHVLPDVEITYYQL